MLPNVEKEASVKLRDRAEYLTEMVRVRGLSLRINSQSRAPSCFRSASEMFERKKPPVRAAFKRLIYRCFLVAGVGFEPTTFRL